MNGAPSEKQMGNGLQNAGHHTGMCASSTDDVLEDEECYAGQLKEYLISQKHLRRPEAGSMSLCSMTWRWLLRIWLPTAGECENILAEESDYQTLWLRNFRAERSQKKGARRTDKWRGTAKEV